jgi:2-oxo-4-hydroxy-4-carboxy-5-ureidoimidazoline decarboxylase
VLRAHPELASKAAVRKELSDASNAEQAGAGLTQCTADEFAQLSQLNAQYRARFGWPFIIAVKGYTRTRIIAALQQRITHDAASEFAECVAQVGRIAALRLAALMENNRDN